MNTEKSPLISVIVPVYKLSLIHISEPTRH